MFWTKCCQTLLLGKNVKTQNIIFSHEVILWLLWRSVKVRSCHSGEAMENNRCNRRALNGWLWSGELCVLRSIRVHRGGVQVKPGTKAGMKAGEQQASKNTPATVWIPASATSFRLSQTSIFSFISPLTFHSVCVRVCYPPANMCWLHAAGGAVSVIKVARRSFLHIFPWHSLKLRTFLAEDSASISAVLCRSSIVLLRNTSHIITYRK